MFNQTAKIISIGNGYSNTWRDDFFEFMNLKIEGIIKKPMKKIGDFTGAILESRSTILGQMILALIKKDHGHLFDQEYCSCPRCGKRIKCANKEAKRRVESLAGSFDLYRPYFFCRSCGVGFCPLDEVLELAPSPKQYDIQELETWLSSELPFKTAEEAYKRSTGESLSAGHMHEITNKIADKLDILDVCPQKDEVDQKIELLSKGKFRRPVMMIAIDGAHAPTRPGPSARNEKRGKGGWQEVKGFRIYLIDQKRIVHLISWHQIQTDKELAAGLLRLKNSGLIPEDKVRLCVIGDGAPWIWNRTAEIFPQAKIVLDFYHCSEHLHEAAHGQYGKGTPEARELVESSLSGLFMNEFDEVISDLESINPRSPEVAEKITNLINYLITHENGVGYGKAKRGGYHIGSGAIESANKFISHVRLKRSGAYWYVQNANNILKIRCAKYNGTYDRIVQKFVVSEQASTFLTGHGRLQKT